MEVDLLVTNVQILTQNEKREIIPNGYLCVKGNKIIAVGEMSSIPEGIKASETMDCPHHILLPGLINTHCHSPMTLFRGFADDLPLMEWLSKHIWPAEAVYTKEKETMKVATEHAICEILKSGTTTLVDGYFQGDVIGEVYDRLGIRGFFGEGILDVFPAPSGTDYRYFWDVVVPALEKYELVQPFIFPHSIYACTKKILEQLKIDLEKHPKMLFSIHACETEKEVEDCKLKNDGKTPIEYLDSLGLITSRTILAHCCHLSENDIKIIKDRDAGISHCVSSNMKLCSGSFPFEKVWSVHKKVSIGTDGASSNNGLDMFREMNIISKLHKLRTMDPTCCPAQDVVWMATQGGANCLGMGDTLGSIEVGKLADFIMVDTFKPHLLPVFNPTSHVVYAMNGGDVEHVFVNGKCVVRAKRMVNIDEVKVLEGIIKLGERVKKESNK